MLVFIYYFLAISNIPGAVVAVIVW